MVRLILPILFALLATGSASAKSSWDDWAAAVGRQCPARHVEWIAGGTYPTVIDDFEKTLPPAIGHRASRLRQAKERGRCNSEKMGFYCEMDAAIEAYKKLNLFKPFVDYGCRNFRCSEPGLCRGR